MLAFAIAARHTTEMIELFLAAGVSATKRQDDISALDVSIKIDGIHVAVQMIGLYRRRLIRIGCKHMMKQLAV